MSVAAVIAILLAVFGLWQMNQAKEQKAIAENKTMIIEEEKDKNYDLFVLANKRKREAQKEKTEADTARSNAEKALLIAEYEKQKAIESEQKARINYIVSGRKDFIDCISSYYNSQKS